MQYHQSDKKDDKKKRSRKKEKEDRKSEEVQKVASQQSSSSQQQQHHYYHPQQSSSQQQQQSFYQSSHQSSLQLQQQQQQQQLTSSLAPHQSGSAQSTVQTTKNYDFMLYPPSSQDEFRSVLLDYLNSEYFNYPMHYVEIFQSLVNLYRGVNKDSEYFMKNLDIIQLFYEFHDKKAITLEKNAVGVKVFEFVVDINREKLTQLSREFHRDRPQKMPVLDPSLAAAGSGSSGNNNSNNSMMSMMMQNNATAGGKFPGPPGLGFYPNLMHTQSMMMTTGPQPPPFGGLGGRNMSAPGSSSNMHNGGGGTSSSSTSAAAAGQGGGGSGISGGGNGSSSNAANPSSSSSGNNTSNANTTTNALLQAGSGVGGKGASSSQLASSTSANSASSQQQYLHHVAQHQHAQFGFSIPNPPVSQQNKQKEIESVLQSSTGMQRVMIELQQQKSNLVNKISAAEEAALQNFRKHGSRSIDYCDFGTRDKCRTLRNSPIPCSKAHFKKIIRPHTDESLGNCSYLDTCRHMEYCKFVHYELDVSEINNNNGTGNSNNNNSNTVGGSGNGGNSNSLGAQQGGDSASKKNGNNNSGGNMNSSSIIKTFDFNDLDDTSNWQNLPPQWINCDLRYIDFRVLGHFNVIMADPPWDIHMTLPYGTLKDREMKALRIDLLQEEGLIFLWVTGRAMELGRECLTIWGYKRVEEIIWVKTNQLQRIIRTGRTGHWLNHSKEHCLVGIKGNPKINQNIDCDVIVSEVRETSRKPDEIYGLIERMCPGGKKIELFGRPHNCKDGWLTLGNQLPDVFLLDHEIVHLFQEAYPETDTSQEAMERNKENLLNQQNIENIYNSHINANPPFRTKSQNQQQQQQQLQLQQQQQSQQQ